MKKKKVEHIMNEYGVGEGTNLLEDLLKEEMADKEKSGICFEGIWKGGSYKNFCES